MKEVILILILLAGISAIVFLAHPKKKKIAVVTKRSMTAMSKLAMVEATVKSLIVVIDDDKTQGRILGWLQKDRYYIESIIATIKASVNMDDFSEENVKKDPVQNTITITLPSPKVEKANILQEKSKVIWKKGAEFKNEELFKYRKEKQEDIDKDEKIQQTIIDQAKQNTEEFFVAWLKTMGYSDANINFMKA